MIDFMTAFPVILVQPTCPGDLRAKGIQFQSTCNLCRESHKTQVWLCFLVLSFLSTSPCAACVPDTSELQIYLDLREANKFQNSDAMLYAPNEVINDVEDNCTLNMLLKCYMLELIMVIHEEDIKAELIFDFNASLQTCIEKTDGCQDGSRRPCESYPLVDITSFLERLKNILQEMKSRNMT